MQVREGRNSLYNHPLLPPPSVLLPRLCPHSLGVARGAGHWEWQAVSPAVTESLLAELGWEASVTPSSVLP